MLINAKIIYKTAEEREMIVQSFFDKDEFSPKNFIRITNDEEVKIRLVFDQVPPQRIISAISACEIISMDYNEATDDIVQKSTDVVAEEKVDADAKAKSDVVAEEKSDVATEEEANITPEVVPEVDEQTGNFAKPEVDNSKTAKAKKATKVVKYKRTGRQAPSSNDYIKLAIFKEAAENASSVDEYVQNVGERIKLSSEDIMYIQRMIVELLKLKQRAFCLTTQQIKEANSNVGHKAVIRFSNKINQKLLAFNVDTSLLHFLCTILKYAKRIDKSSAEGKLEADDSAASEAEVEVENNPADNIADAENAKAETIEPAENEELPKSKFFMSEKFTEIYNMIDKTLPREKQVNDLIKMLGVNENSSLFITITMLAKKAIQMGPFESVELLMEKAGIAPFSESGTRTRLEVAQKVKIICNEMILPELTLTEFFKEIKILFT